MESIKIIGTGSYLPSTVLTNFELEKMEIDTTDEWIVKRTGVRERRIADPDMATSDLAYHASLNALEMAGITVKDIDLIIVATITADTCCPSAANWLQAKLDAPQAVTFDVAAACSGYIFGLNVAEQYLKNKTVKHALVVGAEVISRTVNWKDRSTCILWGDGAGAAVLTIGNDSHKILSTHVHTDGAAGNDLLLPGGGSRTTPISHQSVDKGLHYLNLIEANLSFRIAVRRFKESILEAAEFNNVDVQDINWFIPHQANIRMFQNISKSLKIPFERF
jgi:3-oxoacyl-[acyl-carrier-protein] synthase-3